MTRRFCLALDLENEAQAIAAYEDWHRVGRVPSAVLSSIREAGIEEMEIFRLGTRLVMIIDARDHFSFERKAKMDAADPGVVAWEARMGAFQRAVPGAAAGEKWAHMASLFKLSDHPV